MFFMSLVFVCFVCAMWTIYRVIGQSSRPLAQKILIGISFLIAFFIPVVFKGRGSYEGFFFNLFYYGAYFVFIVVALFFCLIMVRDSIWAIGWLYEKFTHSEKHHFVWKQPALVAKTNRILFVIAAFIAVYGLYGGLKTPDIKETIIETNRIEQPITIVALSDLHLHRTMQQGKINHIVGAVNKLNPDLVVLPGDTVDDEPRRIQDLLAELKKLKSRLGVYATAGNHEFYVGHEKSKKALENVGVTYLFNEGVALKNNLYLAGVPDMYNVKRISDSVDVPKALNSATDKEYKILLSHTPSLIDKIQDQKVDLQISGHTHGGQIFPFHIVSWILNKYLAGLYSVRNSSLYVSRGSGQWGPQIRVLAPSEISVIKLVPENKKEPPVNEKKVDASKIVDKKNVDSQEKQKINKTEEVKKKDENVLKLDKKDAILVSNTEKNNSKLTESTNVPQTGNEKTNNVLLKDKVKKNIVNEKKADSIQFSDKEGKSPTGVSLENKAVEKKLLMAQMEADQEAALKARTKNEDDLKKNDKGLEKKENDKIGDVLSKQEKVLTTEDKAFEDAKAQMDAEFEKVLAQQKVLTEKQEEAQKLADENKKELVRKAEAQEKELRAELEKVKAEAEQSLAAQKEALKTAKNEKEVAQQAIEAQKKLEQQLESVQKELEARKEAEIAVKKELKALQEKQLKTEKEKSVLSTVKLEDSTEKDVQKELKVKGAAEQITPTAQKIIDKMEKAAQKPQLILPGHPSGSKEVLSQTKTKFEPIPLEKNRTVENNTVEKRIDPSAIMQITTHPDGSVTRTIVRTRIQETPTHIKTIKTVTSYTSSPAEERARGRKTLQEVLNNLPPINTEQLIQQIPSIEVPSHGLGAAGESVQSPLMQSEKSIKKVSETIPSTQTQNASVQHLGVTNSLSTIPPALEKALSEPRVPSILPVQF